MPQTGVYQFMTATRIFFLHNPKAGGSSLRSVLSALSPGGFPAPVFGNAPNDHRDGKANVSQFRGFDIYAGHYGYDVYRELADGHLLFTNFRDPVQRIHSMYRYWRNNVALESISALHPGDIEVSTLR